VIVHLPASTVTSLDIDVRSRSSGTFPLRMIVTSPDEIVVVSRSRFTVRSTAVSGVGLRCPPSAQAERHVLQHRQMRKQREILKHQPNTARLGRQVDRGTKNLGPVNPDAARVGPLDPGDHPQGGRLTAARGTQQTHHLARLD
jgi:hypothetical protein